MIFLNLFYCTWKKESFNSVTCVIRIRINILVGRNIFRHVAGVSLTFSAGAKIVFAGWQNSLN